MMRQGGIRPFLPEALQGWVEGRALRDSRVSGHYIFEAVSVRGILG